MSWVDSEQMADDAALGPFDTPDASGVQVMRWLEMVASTLGDVQSHLGTIQGDDLTAVLTRAFDVDALAGQVLDTCWRSYEERV